MYTGRQQKNEAGNKVSRQVECGTRQRVQMRDGRGNTILQGGRLHLIDNRKFSLSENSIHANAPLQRQLLCNILEQSRNRYDVVYWGKVTDFNGGAGAGSQGITGVTSYGATAKVGEKSGSVNKKAFTHEYHRGHLLSQALGGDGSAMNIFKQDGGQNTTGSWPSFELGVLNEKNQASNNIDMYYRIYLNGFLNYDEPLELM